MIKNMKNKINVSLTILVVLILAIVGTWTFWSSDKNKKSVDYSSLEENVKIQEQLGDLENHIDTGAYIPSSEDIIRIVFPNGGEVLEIGKSYNISWENYIGNEPLTIAIEVTTSNGAKYQKRIAENIPAAESGSYNWTATSEMIGNKYKIEVYPEGDRPLVGRSNEFFSITGEPFIIINSPQQLEEIATSSLKVSGKVRKILSEGEFILRFTDQSSALLIEKIIKVENCDWIVGEWCNFEVDLSFEQEKIKDTIVMLNFYQRNEGLGEKLIYSLPVFGQRSKN